MIRLIKLLLTGSLHQHKWKIVHKVQVLDKIKGETMIIAHKYHLQCEECGEMKDFEARN